MKIHDLSNKNRTWYRWTSSLAASLLVAALAGCGSSGGGDTTAAATTPTTPAAPAATAIAAAVTTAAAVATNDTSTNPTAAFTVLQTAGMPVVSVNSPPKVNFTVFSDGAVVKDLTTSNVSFIIAKLVRGTNGTPDQWQSYTYRTETAAATVGPGGKPVLASATQATTDPKQTDAALLAEQLKYNDAGYYTYTFSTDIKDSTKTNGVTFDASATHRVAIQLSYTNKAGTTVRTNPFFDFTIDANGNAVAVTDSAKTRKVVDVTSCNQCHEQLALHGGGRLDTQYCVLCHNAGTTDANSGNVLDFRTMVHKIHAGKLLKEWFGKDYTIWGYRDAEHNYAEVAFPQTTTNCTKCHDSSKSPQADNYKSVPSRAACGTCHGGIDFATGLGVTNKDAYAGKTTSVNGHIGGAQADDSACAICHKATAIPTYHPTIAAYYNSTFTTLTKIAMQTVLPAGAAKFGYEISSVTVSGTPQRATVVFRITKDGTPVTFNTSGTVPITGFTSGPRIYLAYAVPQDGNTTPADFNNYAYQTVENLWKGSGGTLTGPDANGYYTAVLGKATSDGMDIPSTATMVTALLGYGAYNQTMTDTTKYPTGLSLPAQAVQKVATSYTARRVIVDTAKCNNCHEQLGLFKDSSFHSGVRNDANGCAMCHNPNRTSSGWSADSNAFIHAIHGASKRTVKYNWHAASATEGFYNIAYPGILKTCETCHVAGSYDFSNATNSAAIAKALYRTVATGTTAAAGTTTSPYIAQTAGTAYGSGFSYAATTGVTTAAAATTLVNSPIANACFSCHDSATAKTHMSSDGGGSIYEARSTALLKTENCLFCHGTGKLVDIKAQHAK